MIPNCEEVAEILATEKDISWWKRILLRMHLLMCRQCTLYSKHLSALQTGFQKVLSSRADECCERVERIEKDVLEQYQSSE